VAGWGRLVAGAVIGAVGALYATNEEFRKNLPEGARQLPETVRKRFVAAREAAREASMARRAEILRELEAHGGAHETGANRERVAGPSPVALPEGVAGEDDTAVLQDDAVLGRVEGVPGTERRG